MIITFSTLCGSTLRQLHLGTKNFSSSKLLDVFFDNKENWGKRELRPINRPGRAWSKEELRLKSSSDLHKLWYVLLKERNMLLTMEAAYTKRLLSLPNPERVFRVNESMKNLEAVVHERNDAYFRLETGVGADPPQRTVTSFAGFNYKFRLFLREKEYEIPVLDEDAYVMQKLWDEKEHWKKIEEEHDKWREKMLTEDMKRFKRGGRRYINKMEQHGSHTGF
ncbi:unnamed protein product [Enterobius vermicularis]|uniref:Large ribosomal subunit protein uL29m n=1 Tax=Enterobius vermicularis TaxID=51028 RepID=A0A0N4VGT0_ENTVE|nr:unnamed protein product [Enterobius vermicularis]